MDNETSENNFLIIDGNSIMNRTFYAIRLLSTKDGVYTNAIYGFLNIYYMMLDMLKPKYVAVAFDLSAPTFRHKMYSEYKAGRRSMPDELRMQMPLIKEILEAMNVPVFEIEGFEADDILGTVAGENEKRDIHTYILTGDKDSLQLISEKTSIVMPSSKAGKTEYTIYNKEVLREKLNVSPEQVIELKALMGDKSDNIPGIPKVGEKTALSLLESYNSLDNIYENISTIDVSDSLKERLIENKELAYMCKELATICKEVPINLDYDKLILTDVDLPKLSKIFLRLSLKKFLEKYVDDINNINLETKDSEAFFKDLDKYKFIDLLSINNVNEVLNSANKIAFAYMDSKSNYEFLRNKLFLLINENIYFVDLTHETSVTILKEFCKLDKEKIGYNTKSLLKLAFDLKLQELNGFNDDIMIAYYLINATESNYSIENILYNLFDINFPDMTGSTKKVVQTNIFDMLNNDTRPKGMDYSEEEKKYIYTYLKTILESNKVLREKLKELDLFELYSKIEMPLVETLANIESNGMYIDVAKLKSFGQYINGEIKILTDKIYELAGEEFNINSTIQLGNILFDKLQLPTVKKTKKNYSTDKEVLESLIDKHEIIQYILEYRTLSKLSSTYVEGLLNEIGKDGRIHTTFMQAVTATGRLSSVAPNLQNIPVKTEIGKKIRECFTCDDPNNRIVDADYSQIELRVLADMSSDPNMINAYNSDEDIHSVTASQVFKVPLEEVTSQMRSKAKAVNFGIVYGISDYGLAKNINSTKAEAKEYIDNYLAHYTKIDEYMKKLVKDAEDSKYAVTKFGRKRFVPELSSANHNTKMFGERVAMNMPIQGTAADIIKIAMNNLYYAIKRNKLKSKLIMQVHDELIVEAPLNEVETIKELMKKTMESAVKLQVPLVVDIHDGNSWMEAK